MKRSIAALIVLFLTSAPAWARQPQPQEHGRYDFPVKMNGQESALTYEGTHDVMKEPDPEVKLVVFVHHGGSQNPVTYFRNLKQQLRSAGCHGPARGQSVQRREGHCPIGHSAGGQLLSRYSFGTPVYDTLRERGIYVRYIISNPSSVLYFDRQRPDLIDVPHRRGQEDHLRQC